MLERTRAAVGAGVAVAREAGLAGFEPAVLRDAWQVLVHLRPLPVVARVSTSAPSAELDSEQLVRELEVARHAVAAGASVVPPSDLLDAGPYRRDGHIVTFWRYVEPAGELDPRAAGRALRELHEALASYSSPLPAAGHPAETEAMLAALEPSPEAELLRRVFSPPGGGREQALHGDAHLGNCLQAPAGPLWLDLETACRAPREYDLAALSLRDRLGTGSPPARAALAAYGAHERELVEAWQPVYATWVTASMLTALPRRPALGPVTQELLAWLRRRVG